MFSNLETISSIMLGPGKANFHMSRQISVGRPEKSSNLYAIEPVPSFSYFLLSNDIKSKVTRPLMKAGLSQSIDCSAWHLSS